MKVYKYMCTFLEDGQKALCDKEPSDTTPTPCPYIEMQDITPPSNLRGEGKSSLIFTWVRQKPPPSFLHFHF